MLRYIFSYIDKGQWEAETRLDRFEQFGFYAKNPESGQMVRLTNDLPDGQQVIEREQIQKWRREPDGLTFLLWTEPSCTDYISVSDASYEGFLETHEVSGLNQAERLSLLSAVLSLFQDDNHDGCVIVDWRGLLDVAYDDFGPRKFAGCPDLVVSTKQCAFEMPAKSSGRIHTSNRDVWLYSNDGNYIPEALLALVGAVSWDQD